MNYEEIVKRLTEMLEKIGESAKSFGGNTWTLLVEAQKATALAGLVSSLIGVIFAAALYSLAYRLGAGAKAHYEANDHDAEHAGVWFRCAVAMLAMTLGYLDLRTVWETLPMAIAQYRHPAAFVALEAVQRVAPPPKK